MPRLFCQQGDDDLFCDAYTTHTRAHGHDAESDVCTRQTMHTAPRCATATATRTTTGNSSSNSSEVTMLCIRIAAPLLSVHGDDADAHDAAVCTAALPDTSQLLVCRAQTTSLPQQHVSFVYEHVRVPVAHGDDDGNNNSSNNMIASFARHHHTHAWPTQLAVTSATCEGGDGVQHADGAAWCANEYEGSDEEAGAAAAAAATTAHTHMTRHASTALCEDEQEAAAAAAVASCTRARAALQPSVQMRVPQQHPLLSCTRTLTLRAMLATRLPRALTRHVLRALCTCIDAHVQRQQQPPQGYTACCGRTRACLPAWLAAFAHTPQLYTRLTQHAQRQQQQQQQQQQRRLQRSSSHDAVCRRTDAHATVTSTAAAAAPQPQTCAWPPCVPSQSFALRVLYALHSTAVLLMRDMANALHVARGTMSSAVTTSSTAAQGHHNSSGNDDDNDDDRDVRALTRFCDAVFGRAQQHKLLCVLQERMSVPDQQQQRDDDDGDGSVVCASLGCRRVRTDDVAVAAAAAATTTAVTTTMMSAHEDSNNNNSTHTNDTRSGAALPCMLDVVHYLALETLCALLPPLATQLTHFVCHTSGPAARLSRMSESRACTAADDDGAAVAHCVGGAAAAALCRSVHVFVCSMHRWRHWYDDKDDYNSDNEGEECNNCNNNSSSSNSSKQHMTGRSASVLHSSTRQSTAPHGVNKDEDARSVTVWRAAHAHIEAVQLRVTVTYVAVQSLQWLLRDVPRLCARLHHIGSNNNNSSSADDAEAVRASLLTAAVTLARVLLEQLPPLLCGHILPHEADAIFARTLDALCSSSNKSSNSATRTTQAQRMQSPSSTAQQMPMLCHQGSEAHLCVLAYVIAAMTWCSCQLDDNNNNNSSSTRSRDDGDDVRHALTPSMARCWREWLLPLLHVCSCDDGDGDNVDKSARVRAAGSCVMVTAAQAEATHVAPSSAAAAASLVLAEDELRACCVTPLHGTAVTAHTHTVTNSGGNGTTATTWTAMAVPLHYARIALTYFAYVQRVLRLVKQQMRQQQQQLQQQRKRRAAAAGGRRVRTSVRTHEGDDKDADADDESSLCTLSTMATSVTTTTATATLAHAQPAHVPHDTKTTTTTTDGMQQQQPPSLLACRVHYTDVQRVRHVLAHFVSALHRSIDKATTTTTTAAAAQHLSSPSSALLLSSCPLLSAVASFVNGSEWAVTADNASSDEADDLSLSTRSAASAGSYARDGDKDEDGEEEEDDDGAAHVAAAVTVTHTRAARVRCRRAVVGGTRKRTRAARDTALAATAATAVTTASSAATTMTDVSSSSSSGSYTSVSSLTP